ncbi:hypothetical protein ACF068_28695 [Streptomyces sp. NPDC016309]|uniref:hypothetical protein n=1 Tax=Streptomyces sp. NPDC016309 TaxID=3364965 RepID=UPI0036FC36BA
MTTAAARALAVTVLTVLATAAATGAARAHGGTLAVDIAGHRQGHVTARVTWENDADPLDERVAATVNAVSADGSRTAGPWLLIPDPVDDGRFTTAEALPPGRWTVVVEAGHPGLGRDTADLTVPAAAPASPAPAAPARGAAGAAGPTAPAESAGGTTPTTTRATAEAAATSAADSGVPGGTPLVPVAAAGVLLTGGAAAFLAVRNARRRGRT